MTALPLNELVPRYVDAWNDPDPASRRTKLDLLYTDDARLVMRTAVYDGIDEIDGHITDVFDQFIAPGQRRFATGGAVAHHDCVLFRWELREVSDNTLLDGGMNFFELSPDGRIAGDYQFTLGTDSSIGSGTQVFQ